MEQQFIDEVKEMLTNEKRDLLNQLASNNSELKKVIETMETKDSIDIASDTIDGNILEAIGTQKMNKIKMIDSALMRIAQGKYGICIRCGKEIPEARLRAMPYALMCIKCKEDEERRNR